MSYKLNQNDDLWSLSSSDLSNTLTPTFLQGSAVVSTIQPLQQTPIGSIPTYNTNLALSNYENANYHGWIGGDIHSGVLGDPGGFNKDLSSSNAGAVMSTINSLKPPSWYNSVQTDIGSGNVNAATSVLFSNSSTTFSNDHIATTSDIGQGLTDIAKGTAWSVVKGAAAAGAIGALASGNFAAAITNASGAVAANQNATADFDTQAAKDALGDIMQSLDDALSSYDSFGMTSGRNESMWQAQWLP